MDPNDTQASGNDAPQADTADTQPSAASEVTNEAPEANQTEAQGTQPEVNATETAEEKLLAGKYKTPEELEKAYKSLESKFGQTTSEKAELSRILNQAFETPAPAATDDSFREEPDPVNQEIEGLKRTTAVQSFIMTHPNADPAGMQKVLTEDPLVKQISGHDAKLEYAFLRSQNMAQPKAIKEAEKRAADAAVAKTAEKQSAQVETARKTEKTDESADLYNRATGNYSQEDRDAARRELIKKHLVNL